MSKKIRVKPGKSQSKFGFIIGILFCLIGLVVVIPTFGPFGIIWTAVAGYITYVNYRNGFTDKQIDSHVIEIDDSDSHSANVEKESVEERLKKLTDLYMQSLITREEYEQKRKEILDEL